MIETWGTFGTTRRYNNVNIYKDGTSIHNHTIRAAYAAHWFIVKQKDAQLGKLTTQVETLTAHNQAMSFAAEENESTITSLVEKNRQQQLAFHDLTEKNNKLGCAKRSVYVNFQTTQSHQVGRRAQALD